MNDVRKEEVDAALAKIETSIRQVTTGAGTIARPSVPVRTTSVDEVGKMAAEAVLQTYEATAKRVEAMGDEVKARIASLAAALQEADADLAALANTANAIREKGKAVADMVSHATAISKMIREACDDLNAKVGDIEISAK